MLAASQVEISMLFADCKKEGVQSKQFFNQKIKSRYSLTRRNFQRKSRLGEKPLMETNLPVMITQAPTIEINGVHLRVEMVSSFLNRSSFVVKKGLWLKHYPYQCFNYACKKKTTTFFLPNTNPYMKSLHKVDETPPDMTHVSLTSETFQLQALPLQLEQTQVTPMMHCTSNALLHLLV